MNESDVFPAPEIELPLAVPSKWRKWEEERASFHRLLPTLLSSYRGKYVAIHEGQVVDSADNDIELASRVYKNYGYVQIYVGLVSDEPPRVMRIPGPRLLQPEPPT